MPWPCMGVGVKLLWFVVFSKTIQWWWWNIGRNRGQMYSIFIVLPVCIASNIKNTIEYLQSVIQLVFNTLNCFMVNNIVILLHNTFWRKCTLQHLKIQLHYNHETEKFISKIFSSDLAIMCSEFIFCIIMLIHYINAEEHI